MLKKLPFLITLLLFSGLLEAQVDLNLGLRAYYPFSGNANDVSGNNNNPVFNNATLTADRFGNPNSAYHFDGSSSYMRILNSTSLNAGNKMSLVAWVKPQGFYTGTCHGNSVLMKGDADYLPGNYAMRYDDNAYTNGNNCSQAVDVAHQNFYGVDIAPSPPGYTPYIVANQWHCVVLTSDGTTSKLYVDCELKASRPQAATTFTNSYELYIGRLNSAAFPYWVNGDIDEVRIYDRALTTDEVNVLGGCIVPTPCNNWLSTPAQPAFVNIGDLDITGNTLTIEATANRTSFLSNGTITEGDLVSKHSGPADVNYILRPTRALITTTNGFFFTPTVCDISLNKTYHYAMVYDGSTLKFYRNGFLMSQVAATGNLVQNNLNTMIGWLSGQNLNENFVGYINEVRIWNVARSQSQLQTYMNGSLPNPTTIPGLLAYYTFDNLLNKQGNPAWNGALGGGASISATNSACTFVADSCAVATSCNNWLTLPSYASTASIGNLNVSGNQITVEANFNCSNYSTPNFGGNIIAKHTAPNDVCYALSPHAAEIRTSNNGYVFALQNCTFELNKTYHVAMVYDGTSLKFYRNGFLMSQTPCSGTIGTNSLPAIIGNGPALPAANQFFGDINELRIWNVARSQSQIRTYMNSSLPNPTTQTGLLAYYTFDNLLNKQGNSAWNATLSGAASINHTNPSCTFTADSCNSIVSTEGCKGVIELHGNDCVKLPLSQEYYANTGFTWETWFNSSWYENNDNTARLGQSLIIAEDATLCEDIQLGFGWQNIPRNAIGFAVDAPGLCGLRDNNPVYYRPPGGFQPNTWYHVAGVRNYATNQTLLYFNGQLVDTKTNTGAPFSRNILTRIGTYVVAQDSGFAGKMDEIRIWKKARTAAEIAADYNKCLIGTEAGLAAYYKSNERYGLTLHNIVNNASLNGTLDPSVSWNNTTNAPLTSNCGNPITTTVNISICRGTSYEGHTTTGVYTDTFPAANGCDSIKKLNLTVLANIDSVRIGHTNVCLNFSFNGLAYTNTSPVNSWLWNFGDGGQASTQNPSHVYAAPGTYNVQLIVSDINGCKDSITKAVVVSNFTADAGNDIAQCQPTLPASVQLNASAGASYSWTPAALLNNPAIQNPIATISANTRFYVTITSSTGCTATDSVLVTLASAPANTRYPTLNTFPYQQLQLQARTLPGASYQWLPNIGLNNNLLPNPVFYHDQTQEYNIRINTASGCVVVDTQLVVIKGNKGIYVPQGFSPNGDGNNDRLYPILVGIKKLNYFKIYNRWGNLLFETTSGRPEDGWDGTFKGQKQPVETYTWVVEGVDIDNLVIRKNGNTLLIR